MGGRGHVTSENCEMEHLSLVFISDASISTSNTCRRNDMLIISSLCPSRRQ